MISIVICSRNPGIGDALRKNIEETIGVPYELIVVDNSRNEYSIFTAYNLGVSRCNFDIICFMHDDILYRSDRWGAVTLNHFKDSTVGMIGVGGSRYLSRIPSIWWAGGLGMADDAKGSICQNSIDTDLRVSLNILKGNGYLLGGLGKLARSHLLTIARYAVVYDWLSLYLARRCSSPP